MRDSTYLLLKSCDQIGWLVSFQSTVFWWFRKIYCEAIGMCLQAGAVLNAETKEELFSVLSVSHIQMPGSRA
jgi:hypothetical protein